MPKYSKPITAPSKRVCYGANSNRCKYNRAPSHDAPNRLFSMNMCDDTTEKFSLCMHISK